MKKQRHIQTTRTLLSRFRYWGRKNYAAFASMGREFQIGHLHTNVVDVALRKQNAAQTIPYHTFMTLQEIKDQVLAGIDISPDQAAWLANMADSEALYAAAKAHCPAAFLAVDDAPHGQSWLYNTAAYQEALRQLLARAQL